MHRWIKSLVLVLALGSCSSEGREFFPSVIEIAGTVIECTGRYDIGAILSGNSEAIPLGVSGNRSTYEGASQTLRVTGYSTTGRAFTLEITGGGGAFIDTATPAVDNPDLCDYTLTLTCGIATRASNGEPEFSDPAVVTKPGACTGMAGEDESTLALSNARPSIFLDDDPLDPDNLFREAELSTLDGDVELTDVTVSRNGVDTTNQDVTVTVAGVLSYERVDCAPSCP